MAEAIYWRSSSWTWSKGCKEPPGCSSKVIIKFSIIMFLFFQMSCNFLTYCFPIQMRWVLEYLHFLGLYVKHIVLHFCLYFIALVPLAQSGMSHCLCVWVPFHEPSRFWHSYHNDMWGQSESLTCGSGCEILKGSRIGTQILKFLVLKLVLHSVNCEFHIFFLIGCFAW